MPKKRIITDECVSLFDIFQKGPGIQIIFLLLKVILFSLPVV